MALPSSKLSKNINWIKVVFEDITSRSRDLEDFGFGSIDKENQMLKFPYLYLTPLETQLIKSNRSSFQLQEQRVRISIGDRVRLDEENNSDTISDVDEILKGIISEISTDKYYKENRITIVNDIRIVQEFNKSDSKVNRVVCEMTLRMPFTYTICNTPIDKLETIIKDLYVDNGYVIDGYFI